MESYVEYFTDNNIVRVKYKNIYFIKHRFEFLTTSKNIVIKPVQTHTSDSNFKLEPIIKIFENNESLKNYIQKNIIKHIPGITCFFTNYYDEHPGHGLYDTLYPIYHCFLRAGYKNEQFNILYQMGNYTLTNKNKKIYQKFSKGNVFIYFENLFKDTLNYRFDEIIAGSYGAGISCCNKNATLIGDDINAMQKFRNRMLMVYNINSNNTNNLKLKTIIIDSNRYSAKTKKILQEINDYLNKTDKFDSRYIKWPAIPSFKDQLELINSTDIHISGPGTGMLNFPFLRDNSRHINLGAKYFFDDTFSVGYIDNTLTSHISNCKYIKCEFYDIIKFKEVLYDELLENINGINNDKIVLPNYIKIWKEYCILDKNMDNIIERMNPPPHGDLSGYRFPEILVQEKGPFKENIKNPSLNLINHKLLREIKNKYNYY